jgi:hypothetical protein
MSEFYQEAKDLTRPYLSIMFQMVKHFLVLNGHALRSEIDQQNNPKKYAVFRALLIACVTLYVVYELFAHVIFSKDFALTDFLSWTLLFVQFTIVSLLLATPLYLAIRQYGPATHVFVGDIVLLSNLIFTVLLLFGGVFALPASGGFSRDIQEIRAGGGKDTPLYRAMCLYTEKEIERLKIMSDLNAMTGEVDVLLPAAFGRYTPSDSDAQRVQASLDALSPTEKQKAESLRERMEYSVSHIPIKAIGDAQYYVFTRYAPILIVGFVCMLLAILAPIWCYIVSSRAYIRPLPSKQAQRSGVRRLWIAAFCSLVLTFIFIIGASGVPISSSRGWVQTQIDSLSMRAYFNQPFCGTVDPKGLW